MPAHGNKRLDPMRYVPPPTGGCWQWTGPLDAHGYGLWYVTDLKVYKRAHREVYRRLTGSLPDLPLDHECHNVDLTCRGGDTCPHRRCVRPDHLVPRLHRENVLRGRSAPAVHARKTHCPQDHPYDDENTYLAPSGQRFCRACKRARRKAARG